MPNLNKVMLIGNLTRDPELRFTSNNTAVAQLGLAINRQWKDDGGQKKEEVTFIDCEAWGRTAEVLNQYLRKGRPVYIEGRLKLDQWQDKEGNNRSKLKVVVESFQFIGGKDDGEQRQPHGQAAPVRRAAEPAQAAGNHVPLGDPDIPFAADMW